MIESLLLPRQAFEKFLLKLLRRPSVPATSLNLKKSTGFVLNLRVVDAKVVVATLIARLPPSVQHFSNRTEIARLHVRQVLLYCGKNLPAFHVIGFPKPALTMRNIAAM